MTEAAPPPDRRATRLRRNVVVRALSLAVVAMVGAGCQPVGFLAYAIGAEGKVKAAYKLEARKTLVLVDDPSEPAKLPSPQLQNLIAGRVGDRLVAEGVLDRADLIPANRVSQLAAEEADFGQWPIDRVGRAVGAKQVVYVLITGFGVSDNGAIYQPTAEARVKVIDAATGDRLFPDAQAGSGHPVRTQRSYESMDNATPTTDLIVARRLAETLARDVARLFHKYREERVGDRLAG